MLNLNVDNIETVSPTNIYQVWQRYGKQRHFHKGKRLDTSLFAVSEVAADWHELMVYQNIAIYCSH